MNITREKFDVRTFVVVCLLFALAVPGKGIAEDWPTYQHDNERSTDVGVGQRFRAKFGQKNSARGGISKDEGTTHEEGVQKQPQSRLMLIRSDIKERSKSQGTAHCVADRNIDTFI